MGYFSEFAIKIREEDDDHSYPPPEIQLLWRLDDLMDRLSELIEAGAPFRGEFRYIPEDIKYALPEHLCTIEYVERAIEYAKDDLEKQCGIIVESIVSDTEMEELEIYEYIDIPGQMTLEQFIMPEEEDLPLAA